MFWPSHFQAWPPAPAPESGVDFADHSSQSMFLSFWTLGATLFPPLRTHLGLGFLGVFCPLTDALPGDTLSFLRSACPPQHALARCCALIFQELSCLPGQRGSPGPCQKVRDGTLAGAPQTGWFCLLLAGW